MGKSYKKTPIMGHASHKGQKKYKKSAHRAERSVVHSYILTGRYDEIPHPKTYGDEWGSPRDGKQWFGWLKNNLNYKKWLRK